MPNCVSVMPTTGFVRKIRLSKRFVTGQTGALFDDTVRLFSDLSQLRMLSSEEPVIGILILATVYVTRLYCRTEFSQPVVCR